MSKFSVESTYDTLRKKMLDYIKTIYLGKNLELRDACAEELEQPLTISQAPFIEANPAYKQMPSGIFQISSDILGDDIKDYYRKMVDAGLGVFQNPYVHQVEALSAYYKGEDILVATGTGSGKTECFMWPIAGKLYAEALHSPNTWKQRGIRAFMLYPMNALVSDQMGRLRKMIGDHAGKYEEIFSVTRGRRPQFGMYTGRTAYAGDADRKQDQKLAQTLQHNLVSCSAEAKQQLLKIGKYPAKQDMAGFVDKLKKGVHYTSPHDAEMVTRIEMQQCCPDIMITNYSMLEYMLLRRRESNIWEDTKVWLQMDPSNKLLFVIDEAHMYRGSSGGEVALLIRRLMNKLGINRDRLQFILTTASVPSGQEDGVLSFAGDLTSNSDAAHQFKIIYGTPEEIDFTGAVEYTADQFAGINADDFVGDTATKARALRGLASVLNYPTGGVDFNDEAQAEQWLYKALPKVKPVLRMLEQCRGNATRLEDLAAVAFPGSPKESAVYATAVLLAVAPLAKGGDGNVLFPARLHMMFRGLRGLYMCANPSCTCKNNPEKHNLPFGRVYLSKERETCQCGGKIFELMNDRACGALFLRGYIDPNEVENNYVWNKRGVNSKDLLCEVHFFIMGRDEILDKNNFPQKDRNLIRTGWLNTITGRLYTDDSQASNPHMLHVAYFRAANDSKTWSFANCPHCGTSNLTPSDFATKGNEPFFNLVSAQLSTQPQTIFDPDLIAKSPNRGRKVLLFSDSRQRAAILAKDLTRAADEDAMKKALTLAAKRLQEWASENHREPSMDLLYPFVVEIAAENGLRFFYGEDEGTLLNHICAYKEDKEECEEFGDEFDYGEFARKAAPVPGLYHQQLLKQICSNYRSLADVAFCWVAPGSKPLKRALAKLKKAGIAMDEGEYLQVFTAWMIDVLTGSYAYGLSSISNESREIASGRAIRAWGLDEGKIIKKKQRTFVQKQKNLSDAQMDVLVECLQQVTGTVEGKVFINPALVTLRYDPYPEHEWYICPRCKRVAPFTLWGTCLHCLSAAARPMTDSDIEGLRFWRDPVIGALNADSDTIMTSINAEEHTAQLSHKDELDDKMWSTTESFEMRFQNIFAEDSNDAPVDVLSCTTTMEVGIDIGSLTAIGLRNIPPMRENYQQRAGRAGRRGASVSSIVTYVDNGPHDSYYYDHPELIISGNPRLPAIDNKNEKIIFRHLNIVVLNEFLGSQGLGMDTLKVGGFFESCYGKFAAFLEKRTFTAEEVRRLVPLGMDYCADAFKVRLLEQLEQLRLDLDTYPEKYTTTKNEQESLLDALYAGGVMPTYSFPKNVVSFYIESANGKSVVEKPDRSLDIAIQEYAPGRTIVVNKKTYVSGGIYSNQAKWASGRYDNPAQKYLDGRSSEYVKQLYICKNPACQWFSTEAPKDNTCPFCGDKNIFKKTMVKPWGFAPKNGKSVRVSEAENEASYAEAPCYAATPDDPMKTIPGTRHVKLAKRADQQLLIINKGINEEGFVICKRCGAAVPGDDPQLLSTSRDIDKPYVSVVNHAYCRHNDVLPAYLGTDVRTDMVVFEFALDTKKVDATFANGGLWLRQAAITLAEAMLLSAGRLLDVEYSEMKSGYRVRYDEDCSYLDIFIFDSLSSGAGYCSNIADQADQLLEETVKLLRGCTCERSCHKCLNNYWNQRVQDYLDRHAAIDALDYCMEGKLPDPIPAGKANLLFAPVDEMFKEEGDSAVTLSAKAGKFYVEGHGNKLELYFYPAMWTLENPQIPEGAIALSDYEVQFAIPKAYQKIKDAIRYNRSNVPTRGGNSIASCP